MAQEVAEVHEWIVIPGALLATLGLLSIFWLVWGRMLLPIPCRAEVTVTGQGDGAELEQAVKGLLWLRRSGLWRGTVLIRDGGLNTKGMAVARRLTQEPLVELRL